MNHNITGALITAAAGLFIAFANYLISERVLTKAPQKYSLVTVVRQALQIGFLVAVYLVGTRIDSVEITYLLVGAVVGMTLPMLYFTKKLLRVNEKASEAEKEKEDETDG